MNTMTAETKALLNNLIDESEDYDGYAIVDLSKERRGNLTDLKKRGYVTTFVDEGITWAKVSDEGIKAAQA